MNPNLKIIKEDVQGKVPVTVFHLHGWLDSQGEGVLLAAARDAYEAGSRHLLLDLDKVQTLTSAFFFNETAATEIYTPSNERPKMSYVKLCNAQTEIYNVLGVTGFLLTIQNYETLQSAINSFGE